MSAGTPVATTLAVTQPRQAVIDGAWRAIGPGVEVLSGDDGGPLTQDRQAHHRPPCASTALEYAVLGPVRGRRGRIGDARADRRQRPALRDAAAWFEVLKRERRRLRITAGNAQELYFPVCFELAVTKGAPSAAMTKRRRCFATFTPTGTAPVSRSSISSSPTSRSSRNCPNSSGTAGGMCRRAARSPVRSLRAFRPCSGPPRATATRWHGNGSGRR